MSERPTLEFWYEFGSTYTYPECDAHRRRWRLNRESTWRGGRS